MNQRGAVGIALTALACSLIAVILCGFSMYNQSRYALQLAEEQKTQAERRLKADKDLTSAINGTNQILRRFLGSTK